MSETKRPGTTRDIVAIGASAGGLHAISTVLADMAVDLPAVVLVVQHMDPKSISHLAEIIARRTRMRVVEARQGDKVLSGTVYIAPPDKHMMIAGGRISLSSTEQVHFSRPSVDVLLESVAKAYGPRAIGVILTGSGADGAQGMSAIKKAGGLTVAQDPMSAESSSMPRASIATGAVDLVLPLEEIGRAVAGAVLED